MNYTKKEVTMNDIRIRIGQRIKELRIKKGLTTRHLEELTGYSHSNITRIEAGRYSVGIDILCNILNKLDAELEIREKAAE